MVEGHQGFQPKDTFGSEFNAQAFLIYSILARISSATLVQVKAVTNSGGVSAAGTVDVQPLVNFVDGSGKAYVPGTLYKLPYFRMQGGADAIILDPKVNDIGIAIFADRDISSVVKNKAQANPGSSRRFDMADGIYIGGVINGEPFQYIQFTSSGITVSSPTAVMINAPAIKLGNGGTLKKLLTDTFLTWANGHTHTSAASGSPTSPPIVPADVSDEDSVVTVQ